MKTMMFQGEVLADGTLRIEIQTGLVPGPVEGVLVLHPVREQPPQPHNDFETLLARDLPNIDLLSVEEAPLRAATERAWGK
ncbi:MAG TPA: hypothetical protein VN541_20480 [Tepidisphaeraceae bacterium]|nr:hypothetical protein [Tepidisphaeraceae bacterium]